MCIKTEQGRKIRYTAWVTYSTEKCLMFNWQIFYLLWKLYKHSRNEPSGSTKFLWKPCCKVLGSEVKSINAELFAQFSTSAHNSLTLFTWAGTETWQTTWWDIAPYGIYEALYHMLLNAKHLFPVGSADIWIGALATFSTSSTLLQYRQFLLQTLLWSQTNL